MSGLYITEELITIETGEEVNARINAQIAEAARDAALVSEQAAQASEDAALASQSASLVSERAAMASQVDAQSSEDEAEQWARSLVLVEGTYFGAMKYALDAEASAVAADTSETNSLLSEQAAKASETAAGLSEAAALASENASALSETNAAASEAASMSSQLAAKASEDAAALLETASAASETAANLSAVDAQGSEDEAQQWAVSLTEVEPGLYGARKYRNDSDANATAASNSEGAALVSEQAAAASETAAGLSEANALASENLARDWAVSATEVEPGLKSAKSYAQEAKDTVLGALEYKGSWSAATGAYPVSPVKGDFWKVSVAGTVGAASYKVGDSIIFNGTDWDHIDNTESVTSVGGNVGAVTDTQLRDAVKRVDGSLSGLDADLLDGKELATIESEYRAYADTEKVAKTTYTPADVLAKLITVDGATSGLDADLLDGKQLATLETDYQGYTDQAEADAKTYADTGLALKVDKTTYTSADVLAKLLPVDGAGTGLDADLLDGKELTTLEAEYQAYAVEKTSDTGAMYVPSGTTAQRPGAPVFGQQRANSTNGAIEWWNGSAWEAVGSGAKGSAGNQIFVENDQIVTASYTIPATKNAMSTGPITIADGVTVTVSDGAVWQII